MTDQKSCMQIEDFVNAIMILICEAALGESLRQQTLMFNMMCDPIHQEWLRSGSIVAP